MATDTQNPRRVLFVDDDPKFLELTRELMDVFSAGKWVVTTAASASDAFAALQDQTVDLAVIDVQMGVMDGIQMLSLLNRGHPNVQKVVLTGFANENYRAACLSNGAELFLQKPTNQEGWRSLFTALNELLKYKPEEGFRGVLRRVSLPDVLQMECLARNSSVLEVSNGPMKGSIFVEEGQIIHAQIGQRTGEDAFNRLLSMSGGHFSLKPFIEPSARTIKGPWEFLVMEAARQRDEASSDQAAAATPDQAALDQAALDQAALDQAALDQAALDQAALDRAVPATPEKAASAPPVEAGSPPAGDEVVLIDAETGKSMAAELFVAPAPKPPAPAAPPPPTQSSSRPKVEELLICSAHGEVLHQWQCRNVDVWVNFFEFVSQRAQRLAQALPLGKFDRLEILSGDSRAIMIIAADRGVMVKTGNTQC